MAKGKTTLRLGLHLPMLLIAIGLVLMGLWGLHRYLYNRSLRLSDALLATYSQQLDQLAVPVHITVGKKISLRVVEAGRIEGKWTISPTAANHVHGSARPGTGGNIIIYGHNLNTVFGFLVDTKVGDPVNIRTMDGVLHRYKITETHIVSPGQTALLAPTKNEVLTLYTCTGLLDSLRFVARAIPIR